MSVLSSTAAPAASAVDAVGAVVEDEHAAAPKKKTRKGAARTMRASASVSRSAHARSPVAIESLAMSDAPTLSGPDLERGVPASDLREGEPLLGQARGEAVMLVRDRGKVYALSASCTHYGGPLAEGLVSGGTVRCPLAPRVLRSRDRRIARRPAAFAARVLRGRRRRRAGEDWREARRARALGEVGRRRRS